MPTKKNNYTRPGFLDLDAELTITHLIASLTALHYLHIENAFNETEFKRLLLAKLTTKQQKKRKPKKDSAEDAYTHSSDTECTGRDSLVFKLIKQVAVDLKVINARKRGHSWDLKKKLDLLKFEAINNKIWELYSGFVISIVHLKYIRYQA